MTKAYLDISQNYKPRNNGLLSGTWILHMTLFHLTLKSQSEWNLCGSIVPVPWRDSLSIHRKSEALKLYRAFSEIGVDIHPSHTFKAHQSYKVVMWNLKIIAFKIKETLVLRNVYLFLFMANERGIVGSSVIPLCLDKIQFKLR